MYNYVHMPIPFAAYVWSLDLIPLFARLNQTLDGLFRISLSALSFAIVQVCYLVSLLRNNDYQFSVAFHVTDGFTCNWTKDIKTKKRCGILSSCKFYSHYW